MVSGSFNNANNDKYIRSAYEDFDLRFHSAIFHSIVNKRTIKDLKKKKR